MAIDDSFTKSGTVPFKWEIKPGVPKLVQHDKQLLFPSPDSSSPQKLKPPPSWSLALPQSEPRTPFFRSVSRTLSERWLSDKPVLVLPNSVSIGCFPSPLLSRQNSSSIIIKRVSKNTGPEPEPA